jgi:hypothetical protein
MQLYSNVIINVGAPFMGVQAISNEESVKLALEKKV